MPVGIGTGEAGEEASLCAGGELMRSGFPWERSSLETTSPLAKVIVAALVRAWQIDPWGHRPPSHDGGYGAVAALVRAWRIEPGTRTCYCSRTDDRTSQSAQARTGILQGLG